MASPTERAASPRGFPIWPLRLAAGLNMALAIGSACLVVAAPSRAAALVAGGGVVFFGLATAGFALMLRLRLAALTTSRDAAAKRLPR